MRGKVGTLIRDEMNRLYVLHYYRLEEHHESRKVKVWKKETNILSLPEIRRVVQNIWNFIFRLFLNSWGVHTALRKILDTLDEKPQGNNLSKLGNLKYKFPQLWHSAMFESHTSFYFYPLCAFKCHAKSASALPDLYYLR